MDGHDRRHDERAAHARVPSLLAHARSPRGEIHLIGRADAALELRVNGVFVMDTVHTSTERILATSTLDSLPAEVVSRDCHLLVGGLGLGYTLRELLSDSRVGSVRVAEIEPAIIQWHRQGFVAEAADDWCDERVDIRCEDVTDAIKQLRDDQQTGELDAILLDVDNGPGYLVYDSNAAVYRHEFLLTCSRVLSEHGIVAVWSANPAPELEQTMREVFTAVDESAIPVTLGTLSTTYHLYIGRS